MRHHEVVARDDLVRGRTHREPARVVLLVRRHPFVERREVAEPQFVAERGGNHRRMVAVGVGDGLQLALKPVIERGVPVPGETRRATPLVPVAEFAEHHHAQLVGGLERGGGRRPGVELDGVHAVVALDREEAPPFALRHVGIPREREVAVVDVGADEEGAPVEHQPVALATQRPEPETHRLFKPALRVAERDGVEARVELVPGLRLLRQRSRHHHAPFGVGRRHRLETGEREGVGSHARRIGGETLRQLETHPAVRREVREHAHGLERIRLAQLDPPDRAVPDGLHPLAVAVRLHHDPVLLRVVDRDFDAMPARRERPGGDAVDVRRAEGVAEAEFASVDLQPARPHHALQKHFERFGGGLRRKRNRARIDRRAVILVAEGETGLGGAFRVRREMRGRLERSEPGVRQRTGKPHLTGEVRPRAVPFPRKVYAERVRIHRGQRRTRRRTQQKERDGMTALPSPFHTYFSFFHQDVTIPPLPAAVKPTSKSKPRCYKTTLSLHIPRSPFGSKNDSNVLCAGHSPVSIAFRLKEHFG